MAIELLHYKHAARALKTRGPLQRCCVWKIKEFEEQAGLGQALLNEAAANGFWGKWVERAFYWTDEFYSRLLGIDVDAKLCQDVASYKDGMAEQELEEFKPGDPFDLFA